MMLLIILLILVSSCGLFTKYTPPEMPDEGTMGQIDMTPSCPRLDPSKRIPERDAYWDCRLQMYCKPRMINGINKCVPFESTKLMNVFYRDSECLGQITMPNNYYKMPYTDTLDKTIATGTKYVEVQPNIWQSAIQMESGTYYQLDMSRKCIGQQLTMFLITNTTPKIETISETELATIQ